MVAHISSYGDSFAEVYDEWYAAISDVEATVAFLRSRTPASGRVIELGSGTGRLARPLAQAGLQVLGVDASRAMLARCEPVARLQLVEADMACLPFTDKSTSTLFIAFNTLFNLQTRRAMQDCFDEAARVLDEEGCFVVEAFVPPSDGVADDEGVSLRTLDRDVAVLTSAKRQRQTQTIVGQHVEIHHDHLRLRGWRVVFATVSQLDAMAEAAGLALAERYEGWHGEPFDSSSSQHISVYRRA